MPPGNWENALFHRLLGSCSVHMTKPFFLISEKKRKGVRTSIREKEKLRIEHLGRGSKKSMRARKSEKIYCSKSNIRKGRKKKK